MIINKSKETILAERKRLCNTFFSKMSGLMFRSESYINRNSLVFIFSRPVRQAFHMFFVFYPIDIVFLDEKKRVVDINDCFMPFEVYRPKRDALFALELPAGTIRSSSTEIGDQILW